MASEGVLVADSEIQISEGMRSSIREEYGSVPQTDKPTETETQQGEQTKFQRLNKEHLKNSTLRCKIIQFVHHLLFYLAFVVLDLFIGMKYFQDDKSPDDWAFFTWLFIVLPQLVQFLALFLGNPWPSISFQEFKKIVKDKDYDILKNKFEEIKKFDWPYIGSSFPGCHVGKRVYEIFELNPLHLDRSIECLKNLEEAKICNVLFHSGPQMILQSVILLRLNDFSNYWQITSIVLHFIYIVFSTSGFYYTQRSEDPLYVTCYFPKMARYPWFALIIAVRILSLAIMFSYAKSFITVGFIVFFGISLMALYYDLHIPNDPKQPPKHSNFKQLLYILLPIFVPCIKGPRLNFHMVTTLSTAGMHIICQLMLLMHVVFMQVPNSKNFPRFLHCFNENNNTIEGISTKCGEEGQFQSTSLVLASVGIQLFLLLEVILNAAFNSDWKTVMKTSSLTEEEEKSKSNLA